VRGDPGGQVHRRAVHVAVLEDDRAGVDADVGGWQAGRRGALDHVEPGGHGRRGFREVEHPAVAQPPDRPASSAA
jgi:hypothetical protein